MRPARIVRAMVFVAASLLCACVDDGGATVSSGWPTVSSAPRSGSTTPSVPPTDHAIARDGAEAADDLTARPFCSSGQPEEELAELRWTPSREQGSIQLVDVTIFSPRFDDGRFERSDKLSAMRTSMTWDLVSPGAVQFWRVLTLQGDRWVSSKVARFTPPPCIADVVSPSG
jgi:hypothetical protein